MFLDSGADSIRVFRMISKIESMGEDVCGYISVFLQSERWMCQYWSADVAAAIMGLMQEGCQFCETWANGCETK